MKKRTDCRNGTGGAKVRRAGGHHADVAGKGQAKLIQGKEQVTETSMRQPWKKQNEDVGRILAMRALQV